MFMDRKTWYDKITILPDLIYTLNAITIKISAGFVDINKLILQFIWRDKGARLVNTILKEKNKFWRTDTTQLPDLL